MDADHAYKQEDRFVRLVVSALHSMRPLQSSSNCEIKNRTGDTPATDIIRRRRLHSSATLQGLNLKWITVVLYEYVPQFEDCLLTGNDIEGDQD